MLYLQCSQKFQYIRDRNYKSNKCNIRWWWWRPSEHLTPLHCLPLLCCMRSEVFLVWVSSSTLTVNTLSIKGLVHPKMKISLWFTHPRGILGVYDFFLSDESNQVQGSCLFVTYTIIQGIISSEMEEIRVLLKIVLAIPSVIIAVGQWIHWANGYHTSNVQTLHTSYAGERLKSIQPKVKVKTDGAFGIWRCINGAYSLRDDERQINFICWWRYNLF